MNRRGFLGFIAAACVSVGTVTRLAETTLRVDRTQSIIELMQARVAAAKKAFEEQFIRELYSGYDVLTVESDDVLSAAEWTWKQGPVEIEFVDKKFIFLQ